MESGAQALRRKAIHRMMDELERDVMGLIGSYKRNLKPCMEKTGMEACLSRGNMMIGTEDVARSRDCLVHVRGRMRNTAALERALGKKFENQNEAALAAYEAWGADCIARIEGACSVWIIDAAQDRMLVSRDRMGEQIVFYAGDREGIAVSDHPDGLLACGAAQPVLDADGLCELIALGPARTPGKTPLSSIHALKAGHYLHIDADGAQEIPYFELRAQAHTDSEEQTVEHVRYLLEQAINDCVDLHPACMLSGGIDSTALTALLCQRVGRVDSYSVDYAGNDRDYVADAFRPEMDAPYIHLASVAFGTLHRKVLLKQRDLADALDTAVAARGFPGMADVDTSLLLFARQIRKRNASVISGECGDEVFGGYPWFRGNGEIQNGMFPWSGSMELRASILRRDVREKINVADYARNALEASLNSYDVEAAKPADCDLFRIQRLCLDYFMPNLQERASKMCGDCGLEVLTPLCDDRIVQYVYSVPWDMKRMDGIDKGLYRRTVCDIMPEKLRMRKKSPYPKTCSAEYTNLIRDLMTKLIADTRAPLWTFIDVERVAQIAASDLSVTDTPWYGQLMAGPQMLAYLLQINSWMRAREIRLAL